MSMLFSQFVSHSPSSSVSTSPFSTSVSLFLPHLYFDTNITREFFLLSRLVFRPVSGSQQNWTGSPESSCSRLLRTCTAFATKTSSTRGMFFLVVVSCSVVSSSLRPHGLQHAKLPCPSLSPRVLKLMSIESVMPSNHLVLCHPLRLLPLLFPSIRVFSNKSALRIRWPKDWNFSFSTSPSDDYSVLISFRIDWFNLFAVQGNLKSLLQHHSSKASILWCLAFFLVQFLTSIRDYWKKKHSFD